MFMSGIAEEILTKCEQGDERAQYELFKQLHGSLMSICMRYENNSIDAGSLLNEGFYKVLANLKKYDRSKPFIPWAKRVQINTILDHYRKAKKFKKLVNRDVEVENVDIDENVLNEIEQKVEAEYLTDLMKTLPDATRTVFYLYAVDGLKYEEIAKDLKLSKGTIKWHVFNARKVLKEKISALVPSSKQVLQ